MALARIFILAWVFATSSACSLRSTDTAPPERLPAGLFEDHAERLGSLFYDGNAYAGDIAGLSREDCAIAIERRFDAQERDIVHFEVVGKKFLQTFVRRYGNSIVLKSSGNSLLFIGDATAQMEHPGREHVFTLYTEKAKDGDFLIKLVLKFEPMARGTYRFKEFLVSAGRATHVVRCNDLRLVR